MNLSPELLVAKYLRSATKGKMTSLKQIRTWTLILIILWGFMLLSTTFHIYVAIKACPQFRFEREHYAGTLAELLPSEAKDNVFGLIWIAYFILSMLIPWIVLRLKFWISEADKQTNATS